MPLEAASSCDSSPFARLQPPRFNHLRRLLVHHPTALELPFSSSNNHEKYKQQSTSTPAYRRSFLDLHPGRPSRGSRASASLLAANCLPVASAWGPQCTSIRSTASHQPSCQLLAQGLGERPVLQPRLEDTGDLNRHGLPDCQDSRTVRSV
jgi:hypothetical protein